ncbi:MAG: methyltransferase [Candidatus Aenigmatarchaeota archaeon]
MRFILDIGGVPDETKYFMDLLGCKAATIINISEAIKSEPHNGIDIITGDIERSDINGTYDLIIAGELLEHLFDVDAFIEKVRKALNPGGYLLMSTPNAANWFNRISLLFGWSLYGYNPSKK